MADGISELYKTLQPKGVLAKGMTESEFREQTKTDEGLKSLWDYATGSGVFLDEWGTFRAKARRTNVQTTNTGKQTAAQQAINQFATATANAFAATENVQKQAGFQPNQTFNPGVVGALRAGKADAQKVKEEKNRERAIRNAHLPVSPEEAAETFTFESLTGKQGAAHYYKNLDMTPAELLRDKDTVTPFLPGYSRTGDVVKDAQLDYIEASIENDPKYRKMKADVDKRDMSDLETAKATMQRAQEQLQAQVNAGEISVDEANRQLQAKQEKLFGDIEKNHSVRMNLLYKDIQKTEGFQNYSEKKWREEQSKSIDKSIAEGLSAYNAWEDEEYLRRYGITKREFDSKSNLEKQTLSRSMHGAEPSKLLDEEYRMTEGERARTSRLYDESKKLFEDARDLKTAALRQSGFGSAFGKEIGDPDNWLFGIGKMIQLIDFSSISKKIEKGENLSKAEEQFMQAFYTNVNAAALYQGRLTRAYKAGVTTADAIPFMIQMAITWGAEAEIVGALEAAEKWAAKKATSAIEKTAAKKVTTRLAEKYATSEALKTTGKILKYTVKGGNRLIGTMGNAALQTTLFGVPHIVAGSLERQNGQMLIEGDAETGKQELKGIAPGTKQSAAEATRNAFYDEYIEKWSESIFNSLAPIKTGLGNWIGHSKWFGRMASNMKGYSFISRVMDFNRRSWFSQLRRRMQFGGFLEEVAEEEIGGLMRFVCSDVNTLEEAGLDMDSQADIVCGLAPMSMFFGGANAVSSIAHFSKMAYDEHQLRGMLSEEQRGLFDALMRESRSGEFGEKEYDFIHSVISSDEAEDGTKLTPDQKMAILQRVVGKHYDILSSELREASREYAKTQLQTGLDIIDSQAHTDGNIYRAVDSQGRRILIKDGDVKTKDSSLMEGVKFLKSPKKNYLYTVQFADVHWNPLTDKQHQEYAKNIAYLTGVANAEETKSSMIEQCTAVLEGRDEYEFNGNIYNTEDGEFIESKEERDKRTHEEQKNESAKETTPVAEQKTETKPTESETPVEEREEHSVGMNGTAPLRFRLPKLNSKGEQVLDKNGKPVEVDVAFRSSSFYYNADGSIDAKSFSITAGGKGTSGIFSKKERDAYMAAINNRLREEARLQREAEAKAKEEEERKKSADYQRQVAERELEVKRNARRKVLLESIKFNKDGTFGVDVTQEQIFVYNMEKHGKEEALRRAKAQTIQFIEWLRALKDDKKMSENDRYAKTDFYQDSMREIRAAVEFWCGLPELEQFKEAVKKDLRDMRIEGANEDFKNVYNEDINQEPTPAPAPVQEEENGEQEEEPKQEPEPEPAPAVEAEEGTDEKLQARSDAIYDHIHVEVTEKDGVRTTTYIPFAVAEGEKEAKPVENAGKFINRKLLKGGRAADVVINEAANIRDIQVLFTNEENGNIFGEVIISFKDGTAETYDARFTEVPKIGATKREKAAPKPKAEKAKPTKKTGKYNLQDDNVVLIYHKRNGFKVINKEKEKIPKDYEEVEKRLVFDTAGNYYVINSTADQILLLSNRLVPLRDSNGKVLSMSVDDLFTTVNDTATPLGVTDLVKEPEHNVPEAMNDVLDTVIMQKAVEKKVEGSDKTEVSKTTVTLGDVIKHEGYATAYDMITDKAMKMFPDMKIEDVLYEVDGTLKDVVRKWNQYVTKAFNQAKSKNTPFIFDESAFDVYRYMTLRDERGSAIKNGDITRANEINHMMSGFVLEGGKLVRVVPTASMFNVGGNKVKRTKGGNKSAASDKFAFTNSWTKSPLERMIAMMYVLRENPAVNMPGSFFDGMYEKMRTDFDSNIISSAEIVKARKQFKKLNEQLGELKSQGKKDGDEVIRELKSAIDELKDKYPEVEKFAPADVKGLEPLTRIDSKQGYATSVKYYNEVKGHKTEKQEANDEAATEMEAVTKAAVEAYRNGDLDAFIKADERIKEMLKDGKNKGRLESIVASAQKSISASERQKNSKIVTYAGIRRGAEEYKSEMDAAQKRVDSLEKKLDSINKKIEKNSAKKSKKADEKSKQLEADKAKISKDLDKAREKRDGYSETTLATKQRTLAEYEKAHEGIAQQYDEYMAKERPNTMLRPMFQIDDIPATAQSAAARLATQALQYALRRVPGIRVHNLASEEEIELLIEELSGEPFVKPDGTIYGFSVGNDIYLTEDGLNPETMVHEYTHVWLHALSINDKAAYDKIVKMVKKEKLLWDKVTSDPNYQGLTEDEIISEVLARYSGKHGAERLIKEAQEAIGQNPDEKPSTLTMALVKRMRNILDAFWKAVKNFLGIETMDDISDWVLRDIFDGKAINLNEKTAQLTEEEQAIKDKAIADGTYMTHNGLPTKLSEKQWVQVRTKAFKEWFGDWENDPENASKIIDPETKEPMVVFHGTQVVGFDHFETDLDFSVDSGIYSTPIYEVAGVYAHQIAGEMRDAEIEEGFDNLSEAELIRRVDESKKVEGSQGGIYSLFLNMRNPKVVDFADENGLPQRWDRGPVESGQFSVVMEGFPTEYFDTEQEAAQFLYDNGFDPEQETPDGPVIVPIYSTTDMQVDKARLEGYDGVIFKNILDGTENDILNESESEHFYTGMTCLAAFDPVQYKSATLNSGLFSMRDARIQYQISKRDLTEHDDKDIEIVNDKFEKHMQKVYSDPNATVNDCILHEHAWFTKAFDMTDGMRLILKSVSKWREANGLGELDGDKYDVRTKFEGSKPAAEERIIIFNHTVKKKFNDFVKKFAKEISKSEFYQKYKMEVGGEYPTSLRATEIIERYLMARANWERIKIEKDRGVGAFQERMGYTDENGEVHHVNIYEFATEFVQAFGEGKVEQLWKEVKILTDYALDRALEGELISKERYDELKSRKYYVPLRGFWWEDNEKARGEKEKEQETLPLITTVNGMHTLSSQRKAKGGDSLPAGCFAYLYRDVEESIIYAQENLYKLAMFNLLRDHEEWCKDVGFAIPRRAYFQKVPVKDNQGRPTGEYEIKKLKEDPSAEMKQMAKDIQELIKKYRAKLLTLNPNTQEEEIMDIVEQINELEEAMPFLNERESRAVSMAMSKLKKSLTVHLMVDGVVCEIEMPKNFGLTADALNGKAGTDDYGKGNVKIVKSTGSYLSSRMTVYNPSFFVVNVQRDVPYIVSKGSAEYGPLFSARFIKNWGLAQRTVWQYLLTHTFSEGDYGSMLYDFVTNGGKTGYTSLREMQEYRKDAIKMNPKSLEIFLNEVERLGAKGFTKETTIDLAKTIKGTIGVLEMQHAAYVLNEWSEMISRFAAYKTVVDMGLGVNEGIKAAHNLSTNFNRRGLGTVFSNFMNSMTVFSNATVQGAMGVFRTFEGKNAAEVAKKTSLAFSTFIVIPAIVGFISTLLKPDDDNEEERMSDYYRDNFLHIGKYSFAVSDQLKFGFGLGVNAALYAMGRRSMGECAHSLMATFMKNLVPVPQNLSDLAVGTVESLAGEKDWFQTINSFFTPTGLENLSYLAFNRDFMGNKLRYDIGDKPEYEMSPGEADLLKWAAHKHYLLWWHILQHGEPAGPTATGSDGKRLNRLVNLSPKEIRAMLFFVPSGSIDSWCTLFGFNEDAQEGTPAGSHVKTKHTLIQNRLMKSDVMGKNSFRYSIVKDADEYVKQYDNHMLQMEKEYEKNMNLYNSTGNREFLDAANAALKEWELYDQDEVMQNMKAALKEYNDYSVKKVSDKLKMSTEEFKKYYPEDYEYIHENGHEPILALSRALDIKKGLDPHKDKFGIVDWVIEFGKKK